jgi:hypothetical protein
MRFLTELFKRKKTEKEEKKSELTQKSLLEELCGENTELYEALSTTMLLNPRQASREGIGAIVEKAKGFEENGDFTRARIEYGLAGGIALYEAKADLVRKYFRKCAEIDPNYRYRKNFEFFDQEENAERAVKIAQEYYARTMQ